MPIVFFIVNLRDNLFARHFSSILIFVDLQEEHERSLDNSNEAMLATFEKIRIALRGKSKAEIMEAFHAQDSATLCMDLPTGGLTYGRL